MTVWETIALVPALLTFGATVVILSYGLMIIFESTRIISALRRNWREEKKLHFWGTTMDLLVSADN